MVCATGGLASPRPFACKTPRKKSDGEEKRIFYRELHSQIYSQLLLREGAGVTVGAGEIFVNGIDVEERVAFGIEFFEIVAGSLSEDGVAGVAVVGGDGFLRVGGFVIAVVAAEATVPFLVADVIWIGAPVGFHLRKEIRFVDFVSDFDDRIDLSFVRVFASERGGNFFGSFGLGLIGSDEGGDH